jgi:hypothetical protein
MNDAKLRRDHTIKEKNVLPPELNKMLRITSRVPEKELFREETDVIV